MFVRVYYHFMAAVLQVICAKQPLLEGSLVKFNNRFLSSRTIQKRGWLGGESLGDGANAGRNGKQYGLQAITNGANTEQTGEKTDKQTVVTVFSCSHSERNEVR